MLQYMAECETFMFQDQKAFSDVMKMVRFRQSEFESSWDGMPAASLGIDFVGRWVLHFMKRNPKALPVFRRAGLLSVTKRNLKDKMKSSGGLLCIAVRDTNKMILIDAGRMILRVWVRLNQNGFGVQPLSASSLLVYNAASGDLNRIFPTPWVEHFKRGTQFLRDAFELADSEMPIWTIRYGLASPIPDGMRTRRRPVDEVLQIQL